jgi:hypothetical protein
MKKLGVLTGLGMTALALALPVAAGASQNNPSHGQPSRTTVVTKVGASSTAYCVQSSPYGFVAVTETDLTVTTTTNGKSTVADYVKVTAPTTGKTYTYYESNRLVSATSNGDTYAGYGLFGGGSASPLNAGITFINGGTVVINHYGGVQSTTGPTSNVCTTVGIH